jgi:DNA primase catalytic subunit
MKNKLKIAEPCREDWSKMTTVQKGKHCGVCAKQVVDFSENSREEIIDYLDDAEGQTCGRFKKGQIDVYGKSHKAIKNPVIPLYRTIAASIIAILGAGVPSVIAQDHERFQMGGVTSRPIEDIVKNNSNISIKGKISSHNQFVENAKVSIYTDGKLISSILTKTDGKYVFEIRKGVLVNNRFTVKVFATDLETKTIENLEANKTEITIDISMEHEMMLMGDVIAQPEILEVGKPVIKESKTEVKADEIKYYKGNVCVLEKEVVKEPVSKDSVALTMKSVVLTEPLLSQTETSKAEDIEDVVLPEIANPLEVTVYPNPSTSQVFVRTNKNNTYQYGVADLTGKLVFSGTQKGETFELNFTGKPNGVYFISIYQNGIAIKTKRFVISR